MRTATVSRPPETLGAVRSPRRSTNVNGPGQKAAPSRSASAGTSRAIVGYVVERRHMHDEWVAERSALGGEDTVDRRFIECIRT